MENQNQTNREEAISQFYDVKLEQKELTKERKTLTEQFQIYGFASIVYALVYTFCMYQNLAGITSTIMVIGTVIYAYFILKKLGYTFTKKQLPYGIILVLLGINLMITMDAFLHFIDYVAIIMVFVSGVLSVVQNTGKWDLGDSVKAILLHCCNSLGNVFDFAADWGTFAKNKDKKGSIVGYIVLGVVITIPLLVIVVLLLGQADIVFANMLDNVFYDFDFADAIGIGFVFIGALLGAYAWLACFTNKGVSISERNKRTKEPTILIVIGISLGLVYLLFCGIQIMYLFAGVGQLPEGYTYAEYARQGFSELMFVCLINLFIVLIGTKYFRENIVLKIVLTVITGCTYLMVISSAYRMYMYISVYQMSVLRIWVLWTLVWLTFILTGALITIYNNKFSLFVYSMIVTSSLYLIFAFAKPAYLVASYNLSDKYEEQNIDYYYLRSMNPDACPVILEYYETHDDVRTDVIGYFSTYNERQDNKSTIRNFNISRYRYYSVALK